MSTNDFNEKRKAGIKNFAFTASGTNGTSHRKNAAVKKKNHLANQRARAELYATYQGEKGWRNGSTDSMLWHSRLDAISKGNA